MRTRGKFLYLAGGLLVAALALAGEAPECTYTFYGEARDDVMGRCVACAGDVDADGVQDIVAGAYAHSGKKGMARVWSGKDGSTLYSFYGSSSGDWFGMAVSGAGDVNRDGHDDIIVGARQLANGGPGKAYVYSGKDGSTLHTFTGTSGSELGFDVAGAGDVDGDGYADLVVGTGAAKAYVYSGKSGTKLFTLAPAGTGTFVGVDGAGDVNRDGYGDVLLIATKEVLVFSGADGTRLHRWTQSDDLPGVGGYTAEGGDVNGDGYDDVVASGGGYVDGVNCGSVHVFSGKDGTTLRTFYGASELNTYDGLCPSISIAGDVDRDGCDDIAVGWNPYRGGQKQDVIVVYSGADGEPLFSLDGSDGPVHFGCSIALSPVGDLIVGADESGAGSTGRVQVYMNPAPSGSIRIASGAVATASRSVTLSLSWKAPWTPVKDMRLRDAGGSWNSWESVAATRTWELPSDEGPHSVEAQFRDESGITSAIVTDSILLDRSEPGGSITIEQGAPWVNDPVVNVGLDFDDTTSGVASVRLRNAGGVWSEWLTASDSVSWALPALNAIHVVEAQVADHAGNLSPTVADSVGLDMVAPTGSVVLDDGAPYTNQTLVTVGITAADTGGSGLAGMRVRHLGAADSSGYWQPVVESLEWRIPSKDGEQGIQVEFRDHAGNDSVACTGSITLDQTAPTPDAFWINRNRPYVLPLEPVEFTVFTHDGDGGSGVDAFKYTTDGGTSYSEWMSLRLTNRVVGERPAESGRLSVQVVVRDRVGNESDLSAPAETHFVEAEPPWLGCSGAFRGALSDRKDIDAVEIGLVRGDLLSIKVKATATPDTKAFFPFMMDLTRPEGDRLEERIGLAGLVSYVAPASGRYILILREEGEGSEAGQYALSVAVKPLKAGAKWKGECTTGEIVLEAVHGSSLKASLKGAGLDPTGVTVIGPAGAVTATVTGKPGSARLTAILDKGTGEYRIRHIAAGPVAGSLSLARPKGKVLEE